MTKITIISKPDTPFGQARVFPEIAQAEYQQLSRAELTTCIHKTIADLAHVVSRAESILQKARVHNADEYLDGVALNLHGFYMGLEQLFKRVIDTFEGSFITSHPKELLPYMSREIKSLRPAVISMETCCDLAKYQKYCYRVRDASQLHFSTDYIENLTIELRPCYKAVCEDLEQFVQFIEQLP